MVVILSVTIILGAGCSITVIKTCTLNWTYCELMVVTAFKNIKITDVNQTIKGNVKDTLFVLKALFLEKR
jgi:uncharacterized Zn ribbon protein